MIEPQQKWLFKLMGYDLSIEFKKGKNEAVNRTFEMYLHCFTSSR